MWRRRQETFKYCVLYWIFLSYTLSRVISSDVTSSKYCDNSTVSTNCFRPCKHGTCIEHQTPTGVVGGCNCHRGWFGPNCDKCCDKPCGEHGYCHGIYSIKPTLYCKCNPTHTGELCQTELCLRACNNGSCIFENGNQQCDCHAGFFGEHCDQAVSYWAAIGTVTGLGVVLVVLSLIMPYLMWRQRALIVLRIHYFFSRYKEDYSLRFDAFISCTSYLGKDTDFVMDVLCPKLERSMGYKICFGARNFTPGMSYVDNICTAVEQSRRTILLLSTEFLEDTWPIFEVQIAQHESLRSAHRIIPIIYEDLGTISHPTLKNILSSLQCLKWPKSGSDRQVDKFWKKLAVLMNKPKSMSSQNDQEFDLIL